MDSKKIEIQYSEFNAISEMPPEDASLLSSAHDARKKSYAPYSKFNVGCSVLLENGKYLSAGNQENAAYPMCLCAEQVALSTVSSVGEGQKIRAIAITAQSKSQAISHPVAPCGQCRQTILEFEQRQNADIAIILQGATGKIIKLSSIKKLLPLSFDSSSL